MVRPTKFCRRCYTCGERKVLDVPTQDGRFNCVTAKLADGKVRPAQCWLNRFPTVGSDLLAAIKPTIPCGSREAVRLRKKLAFAEALATLEENGQLSTETIKPLIAEMGLIFAGKYLATLPETSSLKKKIKALLHPPKIKTPKIVKCISLPLEFEKALTIWTDISTKRAERMIANGNKYHPDTAPRRINDARYFLEFLTQQGLTNWSQVSQRHLDQYLGKTNRAAAQKAFAFWFAIKRHFPMTGTLARPRNKRPESIFDLILRNDEYDEALELAKSATDTEGALGTFFVMLYAQTITSCLSMTLDNLRTVDGIHQVRFNEIWIPLDSMVAELLEQYLAYREQTLSSQSNGENNLLFLKPGRNLFLSVVKITKQSTKKLRATAIYRILKNGYTDRRGIQISLGVSMTTTAHLERACGWDLQDYVPEEARKLRQDMLNGKLK